MIRKINTVINKFRFPLGLLFVYILLFEFILPINRVLPKPSILFETFESMWADYNLFDSLIVTVSVVYAAMVINLLMVGLTAGKIIQLFKTLPGISESAAFVKYFPLLAFISIIEFWFPHSLPIEYLFGIVISFFMYTGLIRASLKKVDKNYLDSAKSLGMNESQLNSKVIWKSIQPEIFQGIERQHINLWGLILIFEFVNFSYGLGSVYYRMLSYSDFSGIITLSLLIAVIIFAGNLILNYLKEKIIFWE